MEAAGACHPAKDFNHKRCALMVAGTGKDSEDAVTGGDVVYRETWVWATRNLRRKMAAKKRLAK